MNKVVRRWRRMLAPCVVVVALAAVSAFAAAPASAATCAGGGNDFCGVDVSAVAGVSFTGVIVTTDFFCGDAPVVVDWGDGTATSSGTWGTCTVGGGPPSGSLSGTHMYAAAGSYTITITDNSGATVNGVAPVATATASVRDAAADLGVSATAPTTAPSGSSLVYVVSVTNAGSDAAASARLTAVLPYGTAFVSVTAPSGWTCNQPKPGATGVTVSCTIAAFASGASTSGGIAVKVKARGGAGPVNAIFSVSSSTADPNSANNTATVSTAVTKK